MSAAASRPVHFQDASPDNVVFLPPRPQRNGPTAGVHVDVMYQHDGRQQRLRLQTPRFRTAFLNSYTKGDVTTFSMKLLLHDMSNEDSEIGKFVHRWQLPFEKKVLEGAVANVQNWFQKKLSRTRLEEYLVSPIKDAIDRESKLPTDAYPKSLRVKLNKRNGKPDLQMYGPDQEPISYDQFVQDLPRSEVECILEYPSLWFMRKEFGCSPC